MACALHRGFTFLARCTNCEAQQSYKASQRTRILLYGRGRTRRVRARAAIQVGDLVTLDADGYATPVR